MVTKSMDGAVNVPEVVDVVEVEPVDGTVDNVGRGAIIAVGTGRVFKSRSASVIRARIFSIFSERAVAMIAALFSGVRTDGGGTIGLGSGFDGCTVVGCWILVCGVPVPVGSVVVTVRGRVCFEEPGGDVD